MTKPKTSGKRPKGSRRQKNRSSLLGFFALVLLVVVTLAVGFYLIFLFGPWERERPAGEKPLTARKAPAKQQGALPKKPELREKKPGPAAEQPGPPEAAAGKPETDSSALPAKPGSGPKVAIVIDDMGYRRQTGEGLVALDLALSFAFLPHGPHTASLMAKAGQRGRDLLLHFPMEPDDPKTDAGPGLVTAGMPAETLRKAFVENLAVTPGVIGINNHMGSKFTRDRQAMQAFLKLVKAKNLFFLDSRTSADSVGEEVARDLGIKTGRRGVFLDNDQDPTKIKAQLEALLALADQQGSAIGIAHPSEATLAVLADFARHPDPRVTLAPVHELLK